MVVGVTGFEPATTWSQTRCATGLRYAPSFVLRCKDNTYLLNNKIYNTIKRKKTEIFSISVKYTLIDLLFLNSVYKNSYRNIY